MTPDRRRAREHYAPTWQEMAEQTDRAFGRETGVAFASSDRNAGQRVPVSLATFRLPPWQSLVAEGAAVRAAFTNNDKSFAVEETNSPIADHGVGARSGIGRYDVTGHEAFARMYRPAAHARTFGTIVAPPPESFTIENISHFQFLPSVERIKRASVMLAHKIAGHGVSPAMVAAMGVPPATLLDDATKHNIEITIRAEQSHMLYHKAMWRAHGRRVVVLDPTTYTLLAHTDLPKFPASILAAPWPAFYIKFPYRAFEFEIQDVRTGTIDRRWVEGVCVAMDHVEPGYEGPRELAFMAMGEDEGQGSEGRNCAFASMRFGPDATLDEFALQAHRTASSHETHGLGAIGPRVMSTEYGSPDYIGAEELQVHVPRVIVGLMLYLASEHPDVVPVEPAPRRTFADIRSPNQRAAALARQAAELKRTTRLPVLVIGGRLDEQARAIKAQLDRETIDDGPAGTTRKRWTLDRQSWVRGHWRHQPYGPGRHERRLVWIRPFLRGPDAAESMAIRAARVPRAQSNPHPTPR